MIQRIAPALACVLAAGTLTAQVSGGTSSIITASSLHDLTDGRTTALGESAVARARTPLAWNSNPAALAGIDGAGIEYSGRSLDYMGTGGPRYSSAGAFAGTPVGTFALHYNRLHLGEFQWTFDNGTTGETQEAYNETIALSYATDLLGPVSLGATVKLFREELPSVVGPEVAESNPAFYLDIGALFSARGFLDGALAADSIHGGVSVQNLGGEYTYAGVTEGMQVAQHVRAGMAYDVGMLMEEKKPRLRASLSAEYRLLLNPPEVWDNAGYWGAGLEATIYDLVSLRAGAMGFPVDNIYGKEGEPVFRYGAGLNLPFSRIGVSQPISLGFDYAFIPLDPDHRFNDPGRSPLHAFNIRLHYNGEIF